MNEVKTLLDYDRRPMSEKESMLLMQLLMTPDIPKEEILTIPIIKLIHSRIPSDFDVEPHLLMLAGELSEGVPGNCVMWAFTLYKNPQLRAHDNTCLPI